jgi:hypothetical protein
MVVVLAAIAAAAIVQYYNSEKARNASRQRLREIEHMFNQVKPPDLDLSVYDDPKMIAGVPDAKFDFSNITPEQYSVVGKYIPQVADFVEENHPQLVLASETARQGRDAQLEALRKYRDIAGGEFDPRLQQELNQVRDRTNRDARSREASVMAGAQRRGTGGSAAELASQLQGNASAFDREGDASMSAAAEGYRNRLSALASGAELGGKIRDSEMSEAETNAKIANDFNQRFSKRYQEYLQYKADEANNAAIRNLDTKQRVSDANVSQNNRFRVENLERKNRLAQNVFDNSRAQRSDRLNLERDKQDATQRDFDNRMRHTAARAGIQQDYRQDTIDRSRDYNDQARRVGDAAAIGAAEYEGQEDDPPPQEAGYDYGSTPGKYRRNRGDDWRTA